MKNIYLCLIFMALANISFGQDSLNFETEIVFKTTGSAPMKVYELVKEKYIYYGATYDSDGYGHTHYPYSGTSYEREYLLTAPGRIFVPNNKEVSYVVVDTKDWVSTRFLVTTDGKRQVWNLVPTGKNYKLGKKAVVIGVVGLLTSGALFAIAVSQDLKYKASIESYKMDLDFYSRTGINPSEKMDMTLSSVGSPFSFQSSSAPVKPADNRMGYGIPVVASSISLIAVITGISTMFRNSPRAERVE